MYIGYITHAGEENHHDCNVLLLSSYNIYTYIYIVRVMLLFFCNFISNNFNDDEDDDDVDDDSWLELS